VGRVCQRPDQSWMMRRRSKGLDHCYDDPSMGRSTAAPRLSRRRFLRIAGLTGLSAIATNIVRIPGLQSLDAAARRERIARWSDPATWGGRVPGKKDVAVISKKILLNVNARVRGVVIKPTGALIFHPDRSVTLRSKGNVVVRGRLTIRPAKPATIHRLEFPEIDESRFVGGGMKVLPSDVGLWVTGSGVVDVAGSPKLAWTRATGTIASGSTSINLQHDPVGWRVGDEVVLTPTLPPSNTTHDVAYDVGTVASVDRLSRRITLTSPTSFEHPAVEVTPGVVHTPEVLNVTRNVRIEGTAAGRAHVWMHSSRAQSFRYAAFRHLGPRKPIENAFPFSKPVLGRYGLHFHQMEEASKGSIVKGVVVRESGNHAFVTHHSHGVTFRDCVTHDTFEDAYWWDPSPHADVDHAPPTDDVLYERCVASMIRADPPNDGHFRLAGFSLGAREGNAIRDCVAVGVQGGLDSSGYVWPEESHGLWKFENCLAHNNRSNGITVWQTNNFPHVVSRFTAYHNGRFGIRQGQYVNVFLYEDTVLYGNKVGGVLSNATSRVSPVQRFSGLVCDQAGLSPYCVVGAQLVPVPDKAPDFIECQFRGYTKAAFGFIDPFPYPNVLNIINCTFEANEFWLASDIHPGTHIDLSDPARGKITLRRADQPGLFRPEWNASVSHQS
jgi:hypothetical protein